MDGCGFAFEVILRTGLFQKREADSPGGIRVNSPRIPLVVPLKLLSFAHWALNRTDGLLIHDWSNSTGIFLHPFFRCN
jgi:hypothetical protein